MQNDDAGRLRVLVADDSDETQRAVVRQLRDTFEIVDVVSTGRQLVDAALALNPDVIVSDFSIRPLNGAEALKALRDARPRPERSTSRRVPSSPDLGEVSRCPTAQGTPGYA